MSFRRPQIVETVASRRDGDGPALTLSEGRLPVNAGHQIATKAIVDSPLGQPGLATTRSASVRVLVLPPRAGLGGWGFRRSLEQEAVVGRDERVGRHHRVSVVDGPVLAREGDPARALAHPVLELGPDLA